MQKWMRDTNFTELLNTLSRSSHSLVLLFGSVVCVPVMKNTTLKPLILRTFLFLISILIHPWSVWTILRSLLKRVLMGVHKMLCVKQMMVYGMQTHAVLLLLHNQVMFAAREVYSKTSLQQTSARSHLTDTIPTIELYEMYGWIPETSLLTNS